MSRRSTTTARPTELGSSVTDRPKGFGNHFLGCECATCRGAQRKKDLASVPSLRATIETLRADITALERDKGTLERQVLQVSEQLQQSKHDTGVLQRTLEESRRHNQELQKKLNNAESTLRTVRGQLDTIGIEARNLVGERDSLRDQLTNMTQERDVQLAAKQDADGKISRLLELFPGTTYSTLVSDVERQIEDASGEIESLTQERDRWHNDFEKAAQHNERIANHNVELRATLAEFSEKNTALILERHVLSEQVRDLTPFIPVWAQWLAGALLMVGVALIAHQSGFQEGQIAGGAR